MPTELELKYKKTTKEADYVQADLEYHQEVFKIAISDFNQSINKYLNKLSDEDKQNLQALMSAPKKKKEVLEINEGPGDGDSTTLIVNEHGMVEELEKEKDVDETPIREKELKKLFHRIAEHTHPDKSAASGLIAGEVSRRTKLFKKAKTAFETGNWFLLSSMAADLDLPLPEVSEDHLGWLKQDIIRTNKEIAKIANLTAWHWYHGDEEGKRRAIKHYFLQMFKFDHPDL
tara:strand:- start:520 stop:1212 length:693 start_codon:yes stop_codon:yes gene_type:complete